jgi:hypothetical protein
MGLTKDPCPYDARSRASLCRSCCEAHGSLPPCVVAWLDARVGRDIPRPMSLATRREAARRAA